MEHPKNRLFISVGKKMLHSWLFYAILSQIGLSKMLLHTGHICCCSWLLSQQVERQPNAIVNSWDDSLKKSKPKIFFCFPGPS
jgi:hypothetical protein